MQSVKFGYSYDISLQRKWIIRILDDLVINNIYICCWLVITRTKHLLWHFDNIEITFKFYFFGQFYQQHMLCVGTNLYCSYTVYPYIVICNLSKIKLCYVNNAFGSKIWKISWKKVNWSSSGWFSNNIYTTNNNVTFYITLLAAIC